METLPVKWDSGSIRKRNQLEVFDLSASCCMWMSMILYFNFVNHLVLFRALISLVESSGDWWQTHLVVPVIWTWHLLYDWMHLNGSNISLLSPSLFLLLSLAISLLLWRRSLFHQRSQMKGGLYPHLCPSLSTPLSLSPPLALISHLLLRLNNEQSHSFSGTRGFRTCYQLYSRNHMAASNTRDENTRCRCFICVQALSRVFPSPTLSSGLGVWDSCVSVWYCQSGRKQPGDVTITHLSLCGAKTNSVLALIQLWFCEMCSSLEFAMWYCSQNSSKQRITSESSTYFQMLYMPVPVNRMYAWTFSCIHLPLVYEVCGCRFMKAMISYKMSEMVVNMTCGGCVSDSSWELAVMYNMDIVFVNVRLRSCSSIRGCASRLSTVFWLKL